MRQFLSSQCVVILKPAIQAQPDSHEKLVPDVRGVLSPAQWVDQKLQVLLRGDHRNAAVHLTDGSMPSGAVERGVKMTNLRRGGTETMSVAVVDEAVSVTGCAVDGAAAHGLLQP